MLEYIFVAIFGAIIGSFLNVVILREESGEKLTGRSHCPQCKKTLVWYELIPVFSYLIQRGKCRSCGTALSVQYPLVEISTAVVFVLVYANRISDIGYQISSIQYLVSTISTVDIALCIVALLTHWATWSTLIVIFVYDLKTKLIPDKFDLTFAVLALVAVVVSSVTTTYHLPPTTSVSLATSHYALATLYTLGWHLLAGFLLFIPFYALWKYSDGRWMGLGDGKLVVGIGFLLGVAGGFSAVMLAFWIGAAVMLTVIAVQRVVAYVSSRRRPYHLPPTTYHLKSEIPFGPFLIIGCAIVYLLGWTIPAILP